jgi:glycosyltransferase involved in cell wall biosynthesis
VRTTQTGAPDAPSQTTTATPIFASLSIVLVCFDDEPHIAAAIADAHGAGERWATQHEVIVVDDGSTDCTRQIAARIAREYPRTAVIAYERTRGAGAALRTGIAATSGAWVLLTDAHGELDLSELSELVPLTEDANLVVGYRVRRPGRVPRRLPEEARAELVRRTSGIAVRDLECAFELVRGPAVRALHLESDGATIFAELVVRAHRAGWAIAEVAVHPRARRVRHAARGDARAVVRALRDERALMRLLQETDDAHRAKGVG